jgi:hypothetical protein
MAREERYMEQKLESVLPGIEPTGENAQHTTEMGDGMRGRK